MLVDKQSELMSDLLFTVHQHGGDDVTWQPPISYSCFFRALQTARVHPITRYTLPKHKPTLNIEKKKWFPWKVRKRPKKKAGRCHATHLTRGQRVNKLLRPPKLGIICLIRRRQCEQVLTRSRTDLSTDLRSISDRSHLSDLSMNGALTSEFLMQSLNPAPTPLTLFSVRVISLSLPLRLITPTSTLIILDITKTSSNNCL